MVLMMMVMIMMMIILIRKAFDQRPFCGWLYDNNSRVPPSMVYLYYISCLRYTILVGNPRYALFYR